jgi:glycosyltransferase involved in cell wall biosynthesis
LGLPLKYALYFYDFLERKVSEDQLVFAQGAVAFDKHKAASERVLILSTAHSRADIGSVRQKFVSERFCILNVARMHSVKNQQLLVHALSRLRQHDQRWHLRIVGEGARRDELHSLASQLGVSDSVEMPGLIEHGPPLWKEYDTADVFALTSLSEGTPKVVLEAMARGCPVVASAVSGVPTAIGDNQRGILFESQNLEGLIDGLTQMARDGAFRHNCQQQGLEFALDHTIETSSMRMLEKLLHRWPQLAPLRTPDA